MYDRSSLLQSFGECIGKTFKELGFTFIPKAAIQGW